MHRTALVTALVAAGLAGRAGRAGDAAAQPGVTPSAPPAPVAPTAQRSPAPERELSENMALGLSLGATTASWGGLLALAIFADGGGADTGLEVLCGIGTYLGPSVGHVYASKLATRGLGLRTLGVVAAVTGFFQVAGRCETCGSNLPFLFWSGVALYFAGSLDDILTAPLRARRHNQRRAERRAGVTLAPLAVPGGGGGGGGGSAGGLSLVGRF
jgi:hypothetical protein